MLGAAFSGLGTIACLVLAIRSKPKRPTMPPDGDVIPPMPAILYWLLGSLAAAMALLYFWPYDHSSGSLVFYGVVGAGIVLGLVHQMVTLRRRVPGEPPRGRARDV